MAQINKSELASIQTSNGDTTQAIGLRDYSPDMLLMVKRRMLTMSDVLRSIGRFDPTRVTIQQMDLMRKDSMVQLGLHFRKVPLINQKWHIECEDRQVAAFADRALRQIYIGLMTRMLVSFDYGYAPIVQRFKLADLSKVTYEGEDGNPKKLWPTRNVRALVLDDFRLTPPRGAQPEFAADGQTFTGFTNPGVKTAGRDDSLDVPASHALWVTHMKAEHFEDWYGYPLTGYALRYWWSYWFNWLLADRHIEQDADPPLLVRVPGNTEVPDPDDMNPDPNLRRKISAQAMGMMLGERMRNGSTVVLPSDVIQDFEQKPTGTPKWDMQFITGGENMKAFSDRFAYLDAMKFASCLIPPKVLDQVAAASASNDVSSDLGVFFAAVASIEMGILDDHINDFVLPNLVAQNFIDPPPCRKVTQPFQKQDMTAAAQLLTILAQQDPASLDLNVRELVKMTGLPQIAPADRPQAGANFNQPGAGTFGNTPGQADANQQPDAAAGTPQANGVENNPQATPRGGGAPDTGGATAGGISVTGFAQDGVLELAAPRRHELPNVRPFEDSHIAALAEQAYHVLNGFLDDLYTNAAGRLDMAFPAEELAGSDGMVELAVGAWNPDLHPRWPGGTPGGKGGEFAAIKLGDILSRIAKSVSGSLNMSFLARGSHNISSITATRNGDGLRFGVALRDGRKGAIDVNHAEGDISGVMEKLKDIDAGRHDSAPDAPNLPPEPAKPAPPKTPEAPGGETTHPREHKYTPELQALIDAAKNDPELAKFPPDKGSRAEAMFGPFADTQEMWSYLGDDGKRVWAAERRLLHERIIARYLHGKKPSTGEKRALFTAGGPASGKSTGGDDIANFVKIDPDEIKAMLPEWEALQGTKDADGNWITPPDRAIAAVTHEESSDLAKEIMRRAMAEGLDVLIDGTGDTPGGKFADKIKAMKAAGYRTTVMMTDVPVDEAFARAVARAHNTGRFLPWQFLVETHEQVVLNHVGWRRLSEVDEWQVLSNDVPKGADKILLARGGSGDFEILEEELYNRFIEKAGGFHGENVDRPSHFQRAH